jgi:hypothetical protein
MGESAVMLEMLMRAGLEANRADAPKPENQEAQMD